MFASKVKGILKVHLDICSRCDKQMTFSGPKVGRIRVKKLSLDVKRPAPGSCELQFQGTNIFQYCTCPVG